MYSSAIDRHVLFEPRDTHAFSPDSVGNSQHPPPPPQIPPTSEENVCEDQMVGDVLRW